MEQSNNAVGVLITEDDRSQACCVRICAESIESRLAALTPIVAGGGAMTDEADPLHTVGMCIDMLEENLVLMQKVRLW